MKYGFVSLLLAAVVSFGAAQTSDTSSSFRLPVSIGAVAGYNLSRIHATGLMKDYFAPTSGVKPILSPAFGVEADAFFYRNLGVSLGLYYERKGQKTDPALVEFRGDLIPHELETISEIQYTTVPILVKTGIDLRRQWLFLRTGPAFSVLYGQNVHWIIDGQNNSSVAPQPQIEEYEGAWVAGLEYGLKFFTSGVFITMCYKHGLGNFVRGDLAGRQLSGEAYSRTWNMGIGFRRFIL